MSFLGDLFSGVGSVVSAIPGVGSLVGAGANLLGSALGSSLNKSESQDYQMQMMQQNHQWQSEENEKNRQFQSEQWNQQFDRITQYNDPREVYKRLQKAGINPSVAFSQGGTGVASSSATPSALGGASGFSPSPDYSGVVSQGYHSMESIANRLKLLNEAKKTGVESAYLGAKLDAETQKILADMRLSDVQGKAQEFALEIEKQFGRVRASKELRRLEADAIKSVNEAWLAVSQGKYYDQAALTQSVMRLVEHAKKHNLETEGNILEERLKWLPQQLQAEIDAKRAEASDARAGAAYKSALAETENIMRPIRKSIEDNELKFKTETYYDRIDQLRNSLDAQILQNDEIRHTINKLKFADDVREFDYAFNKIQQLIKMGMPTMPDVPAGALYGAAVP